MMTKQLLTLKGVHNFRDAGGYTVYGGQKIKTGMIYRSGHLADLTKSDIDKLTQAGIKLVIDLRSPQECKRYPNRFIYSDSQYYPPIVNLCLNDPTSNVTRIFTKVLSGKYSDFDIEKFLLSEYQRYVVDQVEQITSVFRLLLDPANYPLIIHCMGGRDRTGLLIALIHSMLGVHRSFIFADYLLSQKYLARWGKRALIRYMIVSMFRVKRKQLKPLFEMSPLYLQSALNKIDSHYGSMDTFFESLNFDRKKQILLKQILCH